MKVSGASCPYTVDTVSHDLQHEEFIQQMCDTFQHLNNVANEVFRKVTQKVGEHKQQLSQLNSRMNLVDAKVKQLKGTHKAVQVFSNPKYPVSDDHELYSSSYQSTDHTQHTTHQYHLHSKPMPVDDKMRKKKMNFFSLPAAATDRLSNAEGDKNEGLGRYPSCIQSISSLLLFNTSENLYKKYILLDPLGVVTRTRSDETDDRSMLTEAPRTIVDREELNHFSAENYFYVPGLGDVPELSVPDFLPELIGVADNLLYSADLGQSIAPSLPLSKLPELPLAAPEPSKVYPPQHLPAANSVSTNVTVTSPPPPPPPPPPSSDLPPPPPPPPPLSSDLSAPPAVVTPPQDTSEAGKPVVSLPSSSLVSSNSRSNLLESIRKAGGVGKVKLRSAADRKLESKKKKEQTSGGEDLMTDLAAKLSLRRKGISGTTKARSEVSETASPLDKLSSLIPSIPQTTSNTNNADWD